MTIVLWALTVIMFVGLLLNATEPLNRINRSAVAVFVGVICWLLYIVNASDFVTANHLADFNAFVAKQGDVVGFKDFIASKLFFKYVVKSANIAFFLFATTCIVEVLNNNGCFDFLGEWLKTRRPRKLMWLLAFFTFILSANLDNLVTVILLLTILHPLLQSEKQRRIYGVVVVLAANCGGAVSVIGNITSLKLWNDGLVTPSIYFLTLLLPVLAALVTMLLILSRQLPNRVELALDRLPYRGDDTVLSRPQRLLLLVVGVGGLWFIPSFHRLTLMPPFVGALCVLALVWMINELCNRQLLGSDKMVLRRLPMALQYGNLQNVLYFVGLTLAFGAITETGLFESVGNWVAQNIGNTYAVGLISAALSGLFGHVPALLGMTDVLSHGEGWGAASACDGALWPILSYCTTMGGILLLSSSISGLLLMRMENVSIGWFLRHVTPKVVAGFAVGFVVLVLVTEGILRMQ